MRQGHHPNWRTEMSREFKVLFGKEWKQAVRNRGALMTPILFPVLFLLVIPVAQAFLAASGMATSNIPTGVSLPPGLADASPEAIFVQFTFPFFLVMGGLVVPSVASAVAVALLARDFRTSNNLNGAFMGPMILITIAFSVLLPWGLYRLLLHGALMAGAGAVILLLALKMVSLEKFAL
jgi:hypothetical protein